MFYCNLILSFIFKSCNGFSKLRTLCHWLSRSLVRGHEAAGEGVSALLPAATPTPPSFSPTLSLLPQFTCVYPPAAPPRAPPRGRGPRIINQDKRRTQHGPAPPRPGSQSVRGAQPLCRCRACPVQCSAVQRLGAMLQTTIGPQAHTPIRCAPTWSGSPPEMFPTSRAGLGAWGLLAAG